MPHHTWWSPSVWNKDRKGTTWGHLLTLISKLECFCQILHSCQSTSPYFVWRGIKSCLLSRIQPLHKLTLNSFYIQGTIWVDDWTASWQPARTNFCSDKISAQPSSSSGMMRPLEVTIQMMNRMNYMIIVILIIFLFTLYLRNLREVQLDHLSFVHESRPDL